jgi:hypothetical protein
MCYSKDVWAATAVTFPSLGIQRRAPQPDASLKNRDAPTHGGLAEEEATPSSPAICSVMADVRAVRSDRVVRSGVRSTGEAGQGVFRALATRGK